MKYISHCILAVVVLLLSAISGKTFIFDNNPILFKSISLTFDPGKEEARLGLSFGPKHINVAVGLDNVYRLTQSEGYLRAYKGSWEDDSTFAYRYQVVDYTEWGQASITFKDNRLEALVQEEIEGVRHRLVGRVKE